MQMQIRNTRETYGWIAILLHWIIAAGFVAAYASVYYRHWFTEEKTPENFTALQIHLAVGVTIAVFVLLRIIWKVCKVTPKDPPGTPIEHFASHAMHWTLFVVMIVMPVTGYLGTGLAPKLFYVFEIPKFEDTAAFRVVVEGWLGMTFKEFEVPMDVIHKEGGAYVVWVLVALHAAAALYHHYVRKDFVLKRMTSPAATM